MAQKIENIFLNSVIEHVIHIVKYDKRLKYQDIITELMECSFLILQPETMDTRSNISDKYTMITNLDSIDRTSQILQFCLLQQFLLP